MFKNIIAGVLVVGVLAVSYIGATRPVNVNVTQSSPSVKAVSGPDTYFPYVANNDLQKWGQTKGLVTSTTTVCAFQSPVSTSTLTFASVKFTVGSSTNTTITLAKAASAFATTTILTEASLSANAQGTFMATGTPLLTTGLIGNLVFAPSQWFVVGMADATPKAGTNAFSPVGSCSVEFVRN